jgi:hypothetical protein
MAPRDYAAVRQLAQQHGLSVSAYVRQTATGRLRPGVDQVRELTLSMEALERRLERVEQLAGI